MKSRPSPSKSATSYPEGTVKVGNDGNKWVIKIVSNGQHRWVKHTKLKSKPRSTSRKSKSKPRKPKSKSKSKPKSKKLQRGGTKLDKLALDLEHTSKKAMDSYNKIMAMYKEKEKEKRQAILSQIYQKEKEKEPKGWVKGKNWITRDEFDDSFGTGTDSSFTESNWEFNPDLARGDTRPSSASSSMVGGRPSPSESATSYPEGTVKIGNDGLKWIVKIISNGQHRWVKKKGSPTSSPKSSPTKSSKSSTSSKSSPSKSARPSPSESAKNYPEGTVKVGNDGLKWINKIISNGQYRWVKYSSTARPTARSKARSKPRSPVRKSKSRSKPRKEPSKQRKASVKKNEMVLPMLANKYKSQEITGWYMSEKLDGVRAIWDGTQFQSRTGKVINAPGWFKNAMPNKTLDGELFTKPNDFAGVMSVVSKKVPIDSEWERIKYMVFDMPLNKEQFSKRIDELKKIKVNESLMVIPHIKVKTMEQLEKYHDTIVSKGGEGVMLNKPDALYQNKRTSALLKYISHFDDEVVVQGFDYGSGKNSDVMGKLFVKWLRRDKKFDNGKPVPDVTFNIGGGFTDEQRKNHAKLFPKGTVLKIRYKGLNPSGKARMPTFFAVIPKSMVH